MISIFIFRIAVLKNVDNDLVLYIQTIQIQGISNDRNESDLDRRWRSKVTPNEQIKWS